MEEGIATHSSLENAHGQRSLAHYSPWGFKESDETEQLMLTFSSGPAADSMALDFQFEYLGASH